MPTAASPSLSVKARSFPACHPLIQLEVMDEGLAKLLRRAPRLQAVHLPGLPADRTRYPFIFHYRQRFALGCPRYAAPPLAEQIRKRRETAIHTTLASRNNPLGTPFAASAQSHRRGLARRHKRQFLLSMIDLASISAEMIRSSDNRISMPATNLHCHEQKHFRRLAPRPVRYRESFSFEIAEPFVLHRRRDKSLPDVGHLLIAKAQAQRKGERISMQWL